MLERWGRGRWVRLVRGSDKPFTRVTPGCGGEDPSRQRGPTAEPEQCLIMRPGVGPRLAPSPSRRGLFPTGSPPPPRDGDKDHPPHFEDSLIRSAACPTLVGRLLAPPPQPNSPFPLNGSVMAQNALRTSHFYLLHRFGIPTLRCSRCRPEGRAKKKKL